MMRRLLLTALLLGTVACAPAAEPGVDSLEVFEYLPVLENGRVMPMDTFARTKLLAFSGRSTFARASASTWIARVLFAPEQTEDDAVFLVNHPEVLEAIGLPPPKGRERYSYAQLHPVMEELRDLALKAWKLEQEARSPVEQELIALYSNLGEYAILRMTFGFALPNDHFTITDEQLKADLGLNPELTRFSFLEIIGGLPELRADLEPLLDLAPEAWSTYQRELFNVASAARGLQERRPDPLLRMMPLPGHGDNLWLSPWDVVAFSSGHSDLREDLATLAHMVRAYRDGKQVAFDLAVRSFMASVTKRAPDPGRLRNLKLEVRYNRADAFYRAELLYGFAFLLTLCSVMYDRRMLYAAAIALVVVALVPHTLGILARMKIMGRPPVTNLYATFIFVSWVCALLGLALEYFQRNRLGALTASVSALALLLTSRRFAAEGDTMGVMVAVLDSNFWLATHVVTISIGYAGCCVAGLIGHMYLLQAIFRDPGDGTLRETFGTMYGALAFGLIFSFLGTMLGGIWADQSWGRFWGWDPKENGALIIVLWSALLLHARIAGMVGPAGFAAGCVIGVIWVLLAWLGVNLLGVGLHSYGFTSGLARGLLVACAAELLFVVAVYPLTRRRTG